MRSGSGRASAWTCWAVLTVLLGAGCSAMPDSGDPRRVPLPQRSEADNGVQVRVIPVPPQDGQREREVIQNFLDASIADEGDYRTAKSYLTEDAKKTWNPESGVVVLKDTNPGYPIPGADAHTQIPLKSDQVGQLDAKHSFSSVQDAHYATQFTLVNEAKDAAAKPRWRIASLPDGLVVNQTNFRNTYQQVDRYYYNAVDPTVTGPQTPVLVPDPVYLRRRIDPAGAAVRSLTEGPSDWLNPAVHSAFEGARIVGGVSGDDPRRPKVTVDGVDFGRDKGLCQRMVAQVYFTLAAQGGSGSIDSVTLASTQHLSCDLSSGQAKLSPYAPGGRASSQAYFRRFDTGQLLRLTGPDSAAVPGVLGALAQPAALLPAGGRPAGQFAVSRDGRSAAVVGQDGRSLYRVGLDDAGRLGEAVVVSHGPGPDQGLTSPSWDGFGGLWVVDRDPAGPKVLLVRGASTLTVTVDPLGGRTVDGIRVSSDGTRAALLLKDGSGARSLMLGRVVRSGTPADPVVEITGVRPLAPQLNDVSSVAWADPDLLLALGKETDSALQLHYVGMDGLQSTDPALQAVDGMTVVAASESRQDAVLADSKDSKDADSAHTIYSLGGSSPTSVGTGAPWQWRANVKNGVLPAYPG